jgi:uncharacterized protein YacL
MLLRVVRILFVVAAGCVAWFVTRYFGQAADGVKSVETWVSAIIATVSAATLVCMDIAFRRAFLRNFVAVVVGTVAGMLISGFLIVLVGIFFLPTVSIPEPLTIQNLMLAFKDFAGIARAIIPLVTLATCYLTISVVLRSKDEFRFIVPFVDFAEQGRSHGGLILDSSVLIDGRISEIAEKLKLNDPMIVPRFIVDELQSLADNPDKRIRAKGRRGLDMVNHMQSSPSIRLRVYEGDIPEVEDVDAKLVRLAQALGCRLVTNDFNLAKVAVIEKVEVVNINEVACAMRAPHLPGDAISLKVIRRGDAKGQGVGYLDDGTMVVIEDGQEHIGSAIEVAVTSAIQTSAGRMIFARPTGKSATSAFEVPLSPPTDGKSEKNGR